MTARILDVTPEQYHALPHFSSSLAKTRIASSLLHAKQERDAGRDPNKLLDRGAILHMLLLGKGVRVKPLDYKDWRKDEAKAKRDEARAAGLVPVLAGELNEYRCAALEIQKRLTELGHFIPAPTGTSECAIEWEERWPGGLLTCKGMLDHVILDRGAIYEVKIVDNAHPEQCERTAENLGYAIQAAAYIRALVQLRPELAGRITFRFLFCEPEPPYAIHDPEPDDMFLERGDRDWTRAVREWAHAVETDTWPHYQDHRYISRPRWALAKEGFTRNEW